MSDRFPICHEITAIWEGGWSNHPDDPGGATMWGVTQAVYDAWRRKQGLAIRSVRLITKTEALGIYRQNYWEACGAPKLFAGVDLAVYDASVNSGVSRGLKWLKASVGSNDHSTTVKKICRARLSFMQSLKIWQTFKKGWGRRVADVEAKGVAMALAGMGVSAKSIQAQVVAETAKAKSDAAVAQNVAKTTGAGAGASGGGAALDPAQIDGTALWVLGGVAIVLLIVAAVAFAKKRAADSRAEAYQEIAV